MSQPLLGRRSGGAPVAVLRRDRVTRVVYAELAVFGFFIYGFGPSVQLPRDEQAVSSAVSALHSSGPAIGSIVAGLAGASAVARLGRGTVMRVGLVRLCVGIVLYTMTAALPVTLLGATLGGAAGGLVVNTHAPVLSDHHGRAGTAAISEANALTAAVGVLGPLAIGAGVALEIGWRAGLLAALALALAALLYSRGVRVPDRRDDGPGDPTASTRLPAPYRRAWVVFVACVAVEFSMTIWASDLLRQRDGLDEGAESAAVMLMVGGMALGRQVGSRLSLRRSLLVVAAVVLRALVSRRRTHTPIRRCGAARSASRPWGTCARCLS